MRARPLLPSPLGQRRQRGRGRIVSQKGPAPPALEVVHDLERARVVRLERGRELVEQARLLSDLPGVVAGQPLQFLGGLGAWPQRRQMAVIGPQEGGEDPGIERVALRPTHPEPIAGAVHRFRVDGKDHDPMVQQEVDNPALGLLDRRPHLAPRRAPFIEPPAKLAQAVHRLRHGAAHDFRPRLVLHPHGVFSIRPIHPEVVAHRSSNTPGDVHGARHRAGTAGSPYIGPRRGHLLWNLMPFTHRAGQSPADPQSRMGLEWSSSPRAR